jgi:hypothetical protein
MATVTETRTAAKFSVHVYAFPYLSLVFSAHTIERLCFSLYTAPFDTVCLMVISFAFQWITQLRSEIRSRRVMA